MAGAVCGAGRICTVANGGNTHLVLVVPFRRCGPRGRSGRVKCIRPTCRETVGGEAEANRRELFPEGQAGVLDATT